MVTVLLILTWTTSTIRTSSIIYYAPSPIYSHSWENEESLRNLIRVDTAVATASPNNQLLRQKQNLQRSQKQQLLRQQRLRTHCSAIQLNQDESSTYKHKRKILQSKSDSYIKRVRLITDENKSLAYCHVPKAASTTWMVAFAKTNSVANFTEMLQRVALHEALLEKFAIDGEKLESDTFTFTFIRHPFHRIVSAYLDKFVSRKEKSFIQPVIDWEAGLFGRLSATLHQSHNDGGQFILHFEKFVKFIIFEIESNSKSYGSLHWWPYTKLCDLCRIRYNFIGKVETWESDIQQLSELSEFSNFDLSSLIGQKFNRNKEKTTEDTSKLYFKQLSQDLIIKLYTMYESDFLIGGYDFPQNYINMAKGV